MKRQAGHKQTTTMPLIKLVTTFTFGNDLGTFKEEAVSEIAEILRTEKKYVTLDIAYKKTENGHKTFCDITYFEEFLPSMVKEMYSQAALKLKTLLELYCGEHSFFLKYKSYEDQVLIDWTEKNDVIASIPVEDQGQRRNCWAYVAAFIVSGTYSQEHPSIQDLSEIMTSTQDLSDWVYSFLDLKNEVDNYGYYGGTASQAFAYVKDCGVALLKNYPTEEFKERQIQRTFDVDVFSKIWRGRGDRIFIDHYDCLVPDTIIYQPGTPLHGQPSFSLESITQFIHQGMAFGSIFYCGGCDICEGLDKFDGVGIYDEPPHPKGHNYCQHAVAVTGAGNRHGIDFVRIRNTRGPGWAKDGSGDLQIKFFLELAHVSGTKRKKSSITTQEQ
nr:PREDICTED: uncharacterized protein LOC108226992 isoform X1 [Daucus carota subsp. sativus]